MLFLQCGLHPVIVNHLSSENICVELNRSDSEDAIKDLKIKLSEFDDHQKLKICIL